MSGLDGVASPGSPVARFDAAAEDVIARLRGNPLADKVFYGASALGEHAMVWIVLSMLTYLRGGRHRVNAKRTFVTIFIESAVVNLGIKTLFRRKRPVYEGEHPHKLREPWTSSFPSGHTTASFCAATLLSDRDPKAAPILFALAVTISASRAYVKIHHASDIVAGVAIGIVFGRIARRIAPLPPGR